MKTPCAFFPADISTCPSTNGETFTTSWLFLHLLKQGPVILDGAGIAEHDGMGIRAEYLLLEVFPEPAHHR